MNISSYFIFLLAAVGAAFSQGLPHTVVPSHYDIRLQPLLAESRFEGEETINVRLFTSTRFIKLNAADLQIRSAEISASNSVQSATVTAGDNETILLTVEHPIAASLAQIHLKFSGAFNPKLRGLYGFNIAGKKYAATQFEPTDARRVFPCFDQPDMKATFDITVIADTHDSVISNGRIIADSPGPDLEQHTIKFSTTPRMSSYLVAVAIGDFACLEGVAAAVPIRVCSVPQKKPLLVFALDAAEHFLEFYNSYYGINYPFEKLDIVALPQFAAGAMENTAAIFFSEPLLLVDEKSSSIASQKGVAVVLAHEMAHQWFGDLVTMKWWDDLWLSEGFATWASPKPVAAWKPEWNIETDAIEGTSGAVNHDSYISTHPVHVTLDQTSNPSRIFELFDVITYAKTAAVLRMMERYVGPDIFRIGISEYLKQYAYSNAKSSDFLEVMTRVSGKPVNDVMSTFINQPGVPLVRVKQKCDSKPGIAVSQQRYFFDSQQLHEQHPEHWQIPVCVKGANGSKCVVVTRQAQSLSIQSCGSWVFINSGAQGFYRSSYTPDLLHALEPNIEHALLPTERIRLVSDEWAMVRANEHPIGEYLSLMEWLKRDNSRQVIETISQSLDYIDRYLLTDDDRAPFRRWVTALYHPVLKQLGWTPANNESGDLRSIRSTVLWILGGAGRDPEVLSRARELAEAYMRDPRSADTNSIETILKLAALEGDADLYGHYWEHAKSASNPEEFYHFLSGLLFFDDPQFVNLNLEASITPILNGQDMLGVIGGLLSSPKTSRITWNFLKSHWTEIDKKAPGFGASVLASAVGGLCTENDQTDATNFFLHNGVSADEHAFREGMEKLKECIRVRSQQQSNLRSWLEEHAESQRRITTKEQSLVKPR